MNLNIWLRLGMAFGLGMGSLAIAPLPSSAQTQPMSDCMTKALAAEDLVVAISDLSRAKNWARQAAEAANGGLGVYRADNSMHSALSAAPCTVGADGSWIFTVKGGAPGFVAPTQETVVSVNGSAIAVVYNGPVRP